MWGWNIKVEPPQDARLIMIAAPHTSNWDTVMMLVAASAYRVRIRFLAKKSLFFFPLGPLLRALGGIPIDRSGKLGIVGEAAAAVRGADRIMLAISPEGTRKHTEYWRSGFYWIAREAGVPLVAGVLDYGKKEAAFGPKIDLTGDIVADMNAVRAAFAGVTGKYPALQAPIRLKEEESSAAETVAP
jgi:1-acyl-sn-glycerol-3-phosphate acyltransferase